MKHHNMPQINLKYILIMKNKLL